MAHGFVYLTAVVDVASRRVLAHKTVTTLEAHHAVEIIEQAFARFGIPEIVNTDQGSQFTAEEFTRAVLGRGARLSMDGRDVWRDNVFVERLWRSVKQQSNPCCGLLANVANAENGCVESPWPVRPELSTGARKTCSMPGAFACPRG